MHEIKNLNAFHSCFGINTKIKQLTNGELNPNDYNIRKIYIKDENTFIYYSFDAENDKLEWCAPENIIQTVYRECFIVNYTTEQNNVFNLSFDTLEEALRNYDIILNGFKEYQELKHINITKKTYKTETSVVWGYDSD